MSNKKQALILDKPDFNYQKPFEDQGFECLYLDYTDPERFATVMSKQYMFPTWLDVLVFTGGTDVSPAFYNKKAHPFTRANPKRDSFEEAMFLLAFNYHVPMVGICRGMQFLNVMNGGKLIQHVRNHAGNRIHEVTLLGGYQGIPVNSDHHQLCIPGKNYKNLAWAVNESKGCYDDDDIGKTYEHWSVDNNFELEAVWYPDTLCLGVQWHPEWVDQDAPCRTLFDHMVDALLTPDPKSMDPREVIDAWAT